MPPDQRRRLHVLPVDQPQQALDRARLPRSRRPCAGRRAAAAGRRRDRELQARRPRQVRSRLRDGPPGSTHGWCTCRSAGSAPRRERGCPATTSSSRPSPGLMSLTGDRRRPGVPRRDLGVRRDDRLARADRRARRPAPAHRDRARPARRGQPAVLGDVRTRQPDGRLHGRRRRARRGWATPTRACTPTRRCRPPDRDVIITAGNDRQFRALCEVLGIAEVADDARFRLERRPHRQPRRAAPAAARAGSPSGRPTTCSSPSTRPVSRAGRSTRSPRASSWPSRSGSAPRSTVGRRRSGGRPSSATRSRSATPRSATTCRRRRSASTATRSGRGWRSPRPREPMTRARDGPTTYRTGIGTSDADTITLLGHDLARDLIGQITFGELAFWLVAKRRPTPAQLAMFEAVLVSLADHGFTPTAIAARLTYTSAPESLQGALAAGLLGGGSRFLGVTEDAAQFLSTTPRRAATGRATTTGGTPSPPAAVERAKAAGRLRARTRPPRAQGRGPAHAGAVRSRPAPRHVPRPPPAVRGDRPRPPGDPRSPAAAQRRRHVRRRARRPRPARRRRCAASPCSPAAPASSATWPRRASTRSGWTSTSSVDRHIDYRPPIDDP